MVKEKSAARKYLEECKPLRDGQPAARPYVDIFTRDTDKLYKEVDSAERVKGGYRRCWGWPSASSMGVEADKEIVGEADPEVAALHANLVSHISPSGDPAPQVGEKRPREEGEEEGEGAA